MTQSRNLTADIRASLQAKLERMIAHPLVAAVVRLAQDGQTGSSSEPAAFRFLHAAAQSTQPAASRAAQAAWQENADDGTCTIRIQIDYLDTWRGSEREILEIVRSTIETPVTFLTADQLLLLERSPREFLRLTPRPETAELLGYRTDDIGGAERVTELTVAVPPAAPQHVTHIAIVPNLVQIERQLDAMEQVLRASDDTAYRHRRRSPQGLRRAIRSDGPPRTSPHPATPRLVPRAGHPPRIASLVPSCHPGSRRCP